MAVVHQNLNSTVIIEVRGRYTMAVEECGDPLTCLKRDILELPVLSVPVKRFAFPEGRVQPPAIYLGVNMAISHKQVRPAIVVYIEKKRSPTQDLRSGPKSPE